MKRFFAAVLSFLSSMVIAQDTLIQYNLSKKDISIIAPITNQKEAPILFTRSYTGQNFGAATLPQHAPISNTYPNSSFSKFIKAHNQFNIWKYPIRTAIKIVGYKNDTITSICSGQLIGENYAITAGHCTYFASEKRWLIDSLYVYPAFDQGKSLLSLHTTSVTDVIITKSYIDNKIYQDVCILKLKKEIGKDLGFAGLLYAKDTALYSNQVFHKLSYPGHTPFYPDPDRYNGDTLFYNFGLIDPLPNNQIGLQKFSGRAYQGQSGSSLFCQFNNGYYVTGVLSFATNYLHFKLSASLTQQFGELLGGIYSTSMKEYVKGYLSIYPNPASNFLIIKIPNKKNDWVKLNIYNSIGQRALSKTLNQQLEYKVSLMGLKNGIYFLEVVESNGDVFKRKFVVNH